MIAMLSFCSSFTVVSDTLSYKLLIPFFARPKHELRFPSQEAGVTPEARRDRGRDFAARWGRSRL